MSGAVSSYTDFYKKLGLSNFRVATAQILDIQELLKDLFKP